jgi:GT2 family glycosyltransferase
MCLCAVHNRAELTLRSISQLESAFNQLDYEYDIVIVDDASTDDTVLLISEQHPDVILVKGSGKLYWSGGMRLGFDTNWDDGYTHLLVYNDDVDFNEVNLLCSMKHVFEKNQLSNDTIFVGAVVSKDKMDVTYGVQKKKGRWNPVAFNSLPIKDEIQSGDTLNMNFAVIPRKVIETIGFLDKKYTHSLADYDFGLRAKSKCFDIVQLPKFIGYCDRNVISNTWIDVNMSVSERIEKLHSVKGRPPKECLYYFKKHAGWMFPLYVLYPYYLILTSSVGKYIKRVIS